MASEPDNVLLDHAYDGIQEYDNPMPAWWVWVFVATILFSPLYFFYYHMTPQERGIYAELEADLEAAQAALPDLDESNAAFLGYLQDEEFLAQGKDIFDALCAACHRFDGGGLPALGPNMTDDHYINIRELSDFPDMVRTGNLEKGMTPFEGQLSQREIVRVAAYMASLRGQVVENGKEPEGEEIPAWQ